MNKFNLSLTQGQVRIIADLIYRGAEVEITNPDTKIKIVIRKDVRNKIETKREILELKPNVYGISIDLRELGRRVKKSLKKRK